MFRTWKILTMCDGANPVVTPRQGPDGKRRSSTAGGQRSCNEAGCDFL